MKIVLQRVTRAEVRVDGEVVGKIGRGVLLLVAVERGDTQADVHICARKIASLRIFPDRTPMDLALAEVGGACLVVSQFTIAGSIRKGRRPSFDRAEDPATADALYQALCAELRGQGLPVETGRFAAMMEVELVNDGPVTLLVMSQGGVLI
ncbi:MAG: D-tyrosyl-tRNA(Tyr) deacylase [Myxococcales bacterium]|nr:D-tyrosyl-tRNA(Tyr) deacylase [Myxococcales bacterium]MCB9566472.1 D-tyrosyl-tRNA(Tyr) deacylase [Myxococcales bacterium]MCB9705677.1 D-tyrosyl-tRNA(Tyr) deacylase [Myxococcales bacterium]